MSFMVSNGAADSGRTVGSSGWAVEKAVVRESFNASAWGWGEIYRRKDVYGVIHQHRMRAALELIDGLGLSATSRVLEVGCGAGLTAVEIAKRGCRVEAIDYAPTMVQLARKAAGSAGVADSVNFCLADVHNLPFADRTFDLVLAIGVLPWLPSPARPLSEMARVLLPTGHLIATYDSPWRLGLLLDPLAQFRMLIGGALRAAGLLRPSARARFHSPKVFGAFLLGAGLRMVETKALGYGPLTLMQRPVFSQSAALHCKLQRIADRGNRIVRSIAAQHLVLASKQ